MNKTLKRILIGLAIVAGIFLISRMLFGVGKKDKTEKVAVEKATRRTIIETVNASGRIYPEVEVKISPDISGQITDLRVEEGDSVKKGQVLARIYADIYALQRDEAASRVSQSRSTVANSQASLDALKADLDLAKQSYERNKTAISATVIISVPTLKLFPATLSPSLIFKEEITPSMGATIVVRLRSLFALVRPV